MLIQIPSEPKNLCSHTRFSINQWSRLVRLLEETLQQSSNHALNGIKNRGLKGKDSVGQLSDLFVLMTVVRNQLNTKLQSIEYPFRKKNVWNMVQLSNHLSTRIAIQYPSLLASPTIKMF